jgi:hypothetical protein
MCTIYVGCVPVTTTPLVDPDAQKLVQVTQAVTSGVSTVWGDQDLEPRMKVVSGTLSVTQEDTHSCVMTILLGYDNTLPSPLGYTLALPTQDIASVVIADSNSQYITYSPWNPDFTVQECPPTFDFSNAQRAFMVPYIQVSFPSGLMPRLTVQTDFVTDGMVIVDASANLNLVTPSCPFRMPLFDVKLYPLGTTLDVGPGSFVVMEPDGSFSTAGPPPFSLSPASFGGTFTLNLQSGTAGADPARLTQCLTGFSVPASPPSWTVLACPQVGATEASLVLDLFQPGVGWFKDSVQWTATPQPQGVTWSRTSDGRVQVSLDAPNYLMALTFLSFGDSALLSAPPSVIGLGGTMVTQGIVTSFSCPDSGAVYGTGPHGGAVDLVDVTIRVDVCRLRTGQTGDNGEVEATFYGKHTIPFERGTGLGVAHHVTVPISGCARLSRGSYKLRTLVEKPTWLQAMVHPVDVAAHAVPLTTPTTLVASTLDASVPAFAKKPMQVLPVTPTEKGELLLEDFPWWLLTMAWPLHVEFAERAL